MIGGFGPAGLPDRLIKLDREQMATGVVPDIPEGADVTVGIGLPAMVANFLP